eukprot:Gb_05393 [translate_table: standard]
MYDAISSLLSEIELSKNKMVGFASDGASSMREFYFVDKVANKVYSWLEKSTKRHGEMRELMELF